MPETIAMWLGPKWRMRLVVLLFLLAVFAGICLAKPHVYAEDKSLISRQQAVANALFLVSVDDPDWSIFVIPEKEWKAAVSQPGHTAFTLQGTKLTYVNARWIESVHGDPRKIAPILAHEYGHILCHCTDEGRAESYVSTLNAQH